MKNLSQELYSIFFILFLLTLAACKGRNEAPANEAIDAINLKKGELVSCGPPDKEFGVVGFETSCSEKVRKDFYLAIALLHSFEYDEAEKRLQKLLMQNRDALSPIGE